MDTSVERQRAELTLCGSLHNGGSGFRFCHYGSHLIVLGTALRNTAKRYWNYNEAVSKCVKNSCTVELTKPQGIYTYQPTDRHR